MAKKTNSTFGIGRAPRKPVEVPAMAATPATATVSPPAGAASKPRAAAVLTHDMVARRAYQIWERKGRPVGRDIENWKQAEQELKTELGLR